MLNRFRNVVSNVMSGIPALPGAVNEENEESKTTSSSGRENPLSPAKDRDGALRYAYNRPEFLQLNADEVQVSADHQTRPILVPRDVTRIPWNAGYAEVINAGKTKLNEDQAFAATFMVPHVEDEETEEAPASSGAAGEMNGVSDGAATEREHGTRSPDSISSSEWQMLEKDPLPFTYFAVLDGHAGTGAALMAVKLLHEHIQIQLAKIRKLLICKRYNLEISDTRAGRNHCYDSITADDMVVGALETAFQNMDDQIGEEKKHYKITGGCCVLVSLFFLGKLYVANAGDSRAIICRGSEIVSMSHEFTPETERRRLMYLGQMNPELLHNEFSPLEFPRRVSRHDVSKPLLYRDALMHGWALKTIGVEDTRFPLVSGRGKRSRVMATIGVTRGFGDHDLKVFDSNIFIKPFLSNRPQVEIYDLSKYDHSEDDVLILGSDGLWDVTTNSKATYVIKNCLSQFASDDRSRYTSAAQELVLNARGLLGKGWRTLDDRPASGDDITCFVIPLNRYGNVPSQSSSTESSFDTA